MPRLLVCRECKTIEELPLYDGPKELEAADPLLDNLVRRHVQKHGDMRTDAAALLVASEDICRCNEKKLVDASGTVTMTRPRVGGTHTFWQGHRDDILKGLRERWTGFDPWVYQEMSTFKEDAMRCFNLHRRPAGTDCIDYQTDRKRLTPHDWKGRNVYLCDFCPVNSAVETAKRHAAGLYKRLPGEVD